MSRESSVDRNLILSRGCFEGLDPLDSPALPEVSKVGQHLNAGDHESVNNRTLHPIKGALDWLRVRGPIFCAQNVRLSREVVDQKVLVILDEGRALRLLLQVHDEQQHGVLSEAVCELLQELANMAELACVRYRADEKHRLCSCIKIFQSSNPSPVLLMDLRIIQVIMPE